jgi:2-(1,2-epoxy-1,2-dihydrophenyl)acetyl-CoA isomerase
MKSYQDLNLTIEAGIARLYLNRPDRLNAVRNHTGDELQEAWDALENNPDVRVVIVSGEGRAYGAGYDLSTVNPQEELRLEEVLEKHFNPVVRKMRRSRLPIISRVHGPCAGASVGLALAGDIVIAARSAYFFEPFVGIALVPDAGNTLFLPRAIGRVRAAPMMLLGDRISAEEAERWGLVWKVCDDDKIDAEVDAIADRLVKQSPQAVASTKRLIAMAAEPDLDVLLDLERDLQGEAGRSPEVKAAVAAFFAKRK